MGKLLKYTWNPAPMIEQLGELAGRAQERAPLLERFGHHMVQSSIPANFREGGRPGRWPGTRRGGSPLLDTARLARSVTFEVSGPILKVGTNLIYARIHQLGGVIKAKDKLLPIPVNTPRSMRRPKAYGDRLRWAPGRPGATHAGLLVEKKKRGTRIKAGTVRFVLLRQVEIPARPFLVFQAQDLALFERQTVAWLTEGR